MAIATTTQKETLAVAYGNAATFASLHTAAPGTTGASELTGGAPAYARKAITWAAGGSDGIVTGSVTFDVPASTITAAGLWTAVTAGTFLDSVAVSQTFAAQGQLTVNFTYTQS